VIERMIGAAKLDVKVYEEVEKDTTATQQALLVVVIVAIATGIGSFASGGVLGSLSASSVESVFGQCGLGLPIILAPPF